MLGGHSGPGPRPSPELGALPLGLLRPLRPAGDSPGGGSCSGPSPKEKCVLHFISSPQIRARRCRGEKGFSQPYHGAEPRTLHCFWSGCKMKRGKRHFGEELQIPGRLSEHGTCSWCGAVGGGMGPGVGIPEGDKSQSIYPSVGEHPEPAQLCSYSLHSWIHPNEEESPGFSNKSQPGASPGH